MCSNVPGLLGAGYLAVSPLSCPGRCLFGGGRFVTVSFSQCMGGTASL